ncbi:hypothetical protein BSL78_12669 [Apostichopus japonicus]|uniref:DUF7041 domain-containing protein n=1 Tax=Stichopus japonicus TaxID=307972 RepID=A0A2G8KR64_STIJA|nr:hypothetical protein BSL78_12669 [Apostichopus japonicus]
MSTESDVERTEKSMATVEAQFATKRVTSQDTKYSYIVASLTPDIAQEVRDLLLSPPQADRYKTLKDTLIKRTAVSEQQRLQQLLNEVTLGDRKPSQLLRHMQQLLGETPTNVQLVLASSSEDVKVEQIAELADKILEVATPTVNAVATTTPEVSNIQRLEQQVERLSRQLEDLSMRLNRQQSRSRSSSRKRRDSPAASEKCWYHRTYGDKAQKCRQPCSENTEASN